MMTEQRQREFLIDTMVSLLQRALVYQALVDWLSLVGIPSADIDQVQDSIRSEMEKNAELPNKLRTVVESALQSAEADYDLILASSLSLWKSTGKPN